MTRALPPSSLPSDSWSVDAPPLYTRRSPSPWEASRERMALSKDCTAQRRGIQAAVWRLLNGPCAAAAERQLTAPWGEGWLGRWKILQGGNQAQVAHNRPAPACIPVCNAGLDSVMQRTAGVTAVSLLQRISGICCRFSRLTASLASSLDRVASSSAPACRTSKLMSRRTCKPARVPMGAR